MHPATGMPLSRARGQHLIHNVGVVQKMVEAAELRSTDAVYEVGCGTGELTVRLLEEVRLVHTIDIEARMVEETQQRSEAAGLHNLSARVGDALRLPMPRRFDVCVSNLPYQISSPFIFRLLRQLSVGPPWRHAVLMVQREFAERLLADPGEQPFSRLALNVRLFARGVRLFDVKPGSFMPAPSVHSTVIKLEPRLPAPEVDFAEWDAMIRVIFSRRRKTLRAQFKKLSTTSMLEHNHKVWCSLAGEKPSALPFPELVMSVLEEERCVHERAFAMDIDDLHSLLKAFNRKGIRFVNVQGDFRGPEGELLRGGPRPDGDEDAAPVLGAAMHRNKPPPGPGAAFGEWRPPGMPGAPPGPPPGLVAAPQGPPRGAGGLSYP